MKLQSKCTKNHPKERITNVLISNIFFCNFKYYKNIKYMV